MTPQQLEALRLRMGLTQKQMSVKIGIGRRMYAYVKKGEKKLGNASVLLAKIYSARYKRCSASKNKTD